MCQRRPVRTLTVGITVVLLASVVLIVDQVAKYLALTHLPMQQPVHVVGNFLIFFLIKNSGAAFSLGSNITGVFTVALAVVALVIIYLVGTRVRARSWSIILGLLLGGVLGNLSDRLFREPGFGVGHVVDFINTPWMMPATYNVADMFITTMMVGVAILVVLGVRLDGMRAKRASDDAPAEH
ncbi:hypothetical protein GCM10022240_28380 [Microbacterium kribbense]|uniref:Lipoprotein signal peptidase n=1 Tax=Microbacterium kribbense TaxID=433645 RepID=A0ABP7GW91_9MICO